MSSWQKTRLAVLLDGDVDKMVTPIESYTPTFNLNTEVIHSIEATHVGYVANPDSFTFSMTVRAIGGSVARLTKLAMEGTEFQIGLYKAEGSADEWDFSEIVLDNCLITSASPSNASASGAPTAQFSGVSRIAKAKDNGDTVLSLPEFPA